MEADRCPCSSGVDYDGCCGRLHRGDGQAVTAEALMRSRYSAFVVGDEGYLLRSWGAAFRPSRVGIRDDDEWLGLEILATDLGRALDATGTVDFVATVRRGGQVQQLREISRFGREQGRWVYLDGRHPLD